MWSYKDRNGNEHSNTSVEEIRKAIEDNSITESTPLRNLKISQDWVAAKHTSFFTTSSHPIPEKGASSPSLFEAAIPPPAAEPLRHFKSRPIGSILFLALLAIPFLSIGALASLIYLEESSRQTLQAQLDELNARLTRKTTLAKEFSTVAKKLEISKAFTSPSSSPESLEQQEINSLQLEANKIQSDLNNYSLLGDPTHLNKGVESSQKKLNQLLRLAPYMCISIIIPYLFAISHYSKSARLITPNSHAASVILHSIPGLNLTMYSFISARWNLEGTQRKNSLLLTLPLSACALFCLGLAVYHYHFQQHHWVGVSVVLLILWGALHLRQIQMLRYADDRNID